VPLLPGVASQGTAGAHPAPAALATSSAPAEVAAAGAGASIKVENGVVKFYFASAQATLAEGAAAALGDVAKGTQAGKTAVVSGFHDSTGDPGKNAELAKQRAVNVREALKGAGVAEDKIELKKPEQINAGDAAEARRVEVSLR
jgi:K(+)-stimulated pyrophosphate-energized sodium pump